MAMRSAIARFPHPSSPAIQAAASRSSLRCFSDEKGRVLSEEERAKETVYIQKMERERLEKLRLKLEKEKAEKEKAEKEKKN